MALYLDNALSIGNTPLVHLNRLVPSTAKVFAKIEGRNPSYSVKCRVGANLIRNAEERGVLKKGMHIIEPTSGNTGIALAYVAAAKGYPITLTMPETMSIERRKLLAMLGANLILTPGLEGMGGAIKHAEAMAAERPELYFLPQQFNNPANPQIHELTTGPEIWKDTNGQVDVVISAVGTGGTLTGISRYLKNTMGKNICSVAVEPAASPVISQFLAGAPLQPGPHKIQGIGAGFIPQTLDTSLLDRVEQVSNEEAIQCARDLATQEGILAGISSGAAMAAASRLVALEEFAQKTIVVILPDSAERYLSSPLFEGIA